MHPLGQALDFGVVVCRETKFIVIMFTNPVRAASVYSSTTHEIPSPSMPVGAAGPERTTGLERTVGLRHTWSRDRTVTLERPSSAS